MLEKPPNADPLTARCSIQWVVDFEDILSVEAAGAASSGTAKAGASAPSQVRRDRKRLDPLRLAATGNGSIPLGWLQPETTRYPFPALHL